MELFVEKIPGGIPSEILGEFQVEFSDLSWSDFWKMFELCLGEIFEGTTEIFRKLLKKNLNFSVVDFPNTSSMRNSHEKILEGVSGKIRHSLEKQQEEC